MKVSSQLDVTLISLPIYQCLPGLTLPFTSTDRQQSELIYNAWKSQQPIVVVPQLNTTCSGGIGCLVEVAALDEQESQAVKGLFRSLQRVELLSLNAQESTARVNVLVDVYPESPHRDRVARRRELVAAFFSRFPQYAQQPLYLSLLEREFTYGALCDMLAFGCQLNQDDYLDVLSELNVDLRSDLVLKLLTQASKQPAGSCFPPLFSFN